MPIESPSPCYAALGRNQLVCTVGDGAVPTGYVVIDSTVRGRSYGGLRFMPDVDETELRDLAFNQTLKYAVVGLPCGGAKAGLRGDPEAPETERRQRLSDFGRQISPLVRSGMYRPGQDMGTRAADLRHFLEAAGVPPRYRDLRVTRSGDYTALTVLAGVLAAANHRGIALDRATAAIEGFGAVGGALAPLLAGVGVRVVAVSTLRGALYNPAGLDIARLTALVRASGGSYVVECYRGAERLDRSALFELPVDFLCPCARHGSVHSGNVARIHARVICSGANMAVTPEADRMLASQGVLCLPDFVTNCGGVLGSTMAFAAVGEDAIADFITRRVGAQIPRLLREADRCGVTPREVALPLALARFSEISRDEGAGGMRARVLALGVELYRRGWIPQQIVGMLAPAYFERTFARPLTAPDLLGKD